LLLSKKLLPTQWISVVTLTMGVAMVQLSQQAGSAEGKKDSIVGLVSVVFSCLTSGFAGVYFELVLKSSNVSIWMRNVQLSVIGIVVSLTSCYLRDSVAIGAKGKHHTTPHHTTKLDLDTTSKF
jgi:UDP-sugar transporter A1/2/3